MTTNEDAFKAGRSAYLQEQDLIDNPYHGMEPRSWWQAGWWAANDDEERIPRNELID